MPKTTQDAPQQHVKLAAVTDAAGHGQSPVLQREKRLSANSQSPLWNRYTESRLRQFVTRQ